MPRRNRRVREESDGWQTAADALAADLARIWAKRTARKPRPRRKEENR